MKSDKEIIEYVNRDNNRPENHKKKKLLSNIIILTIAIIMFTIGIPLVFVIIPIIPSIRAVNVLIRDNDVKRNRVRAYLEFIICFAVILIVIFIVNRYISGASAFFNINIKNFI